MGVMFASLLLGLSPRRKPRTRTGGALIKSKLPRDRASRVHRLNGFRRQTKQPAGNRGLQPIRYYDEPSASSIRKAAFPDVVSVPKPNCSIS